MRGLVAGIAGAAILASPAVAAAHSLLLEARPAANSAVVAPPRVMLRFNNRIEKRLSRITVLDERGTPHALAIAAADGGADRLTAAMPPLAPGAYRVEWHVLSTDGHVVSGSFGFRLAR